ncbi:MULTISPECIES: ESX secretion-associated protein EspG [Prauserella salsuginis group]|uniref:ESX secretion-associated protein EspG n=1 Tax=Prauserella salsuginis TaxID=387889 RepID=A0ABW6FZS7_9PSEU|nr:MULTISPECIES: ESX secretion-associated protein EspG [Prauserella salsuginis group]MCR3720210.1 EspG family protein [Prauserella flava]MCR3734081.1 EspG family protein [Prauserella salsuginis]
MAQTFSLSLVAVDILLEQYKLGRSPFPFEIPHMGTTHTQRNQVREAVFRDLETRGLARGGRLEPDAETALETFVRAPLIVALAGQLADEEEIYARSVSDGQFALLVRQDANMLTFTEVRPTNFVAELVDLLPLTKPAPGQSITVPVPAARKSRQAEGGYDPFGGVKAPRSSQTTSQERAVARLFEKKMERIGFITAFVPGDGGRPAKLDPVMWFDNEDGRHLGTQRAAEDGQKWATYAPADNARIVSQLYTQLEPYL